MSRSGSFKLLQVNYAQAGLNCVVAGSASSRSVHRFLRQGRLDCDLSPLSASAEIHTRYRRAKADQPELLADQPPASDEHSYRASAAPHGPARPPLHKKREFSPLPCRSLYLLAIGLVYTLPCKYRDLSRIQPVGNRHPPPVQSRHPAPTLYVRRYSVYRWARKSRPGVSSAA